MCPNLMNLSRDLNPPKPVSIKHRLKSWNIEYNFKWNQLYLGRGLNLSRRSNSLNSASDQMESSKYNKMLDIISKINFYQYI